jgi:predicted lysophospholipase L1 biosynthesis ABC-type transport system permease subunit
MGSTLHIKLRPNNAGGTLWKNTLAAMRRDYHMFYPEGTFTYRFLDDTIANFYESEQRTARLLAWATALAILISSLGLLGLVIYTTSLRTKEIGIRKVLGASMTQIVSMLSADFMRWVLVAFMIAAPLAWWATHRWLEGFAYRTALNWWIFLLSGLVMIFFAFATLSLQTIRAARANPVNSLATE